MRFELEKVLAHVEALDRCVDQEPNSPDRPIADDVAARFRAAGLRVEQLVAPSVRPPGARFDLPWIALALLATAQSLVVSQGYRSALLLTVVGELFVTWLGPRLEKHVAARDPERLPIVVGTRPRENARSLHLIVASPLRRLPVLWLGISEVVLRSIMLCAAGINFGLNVRKVAHQSAGVVVVPLVFAWIALVLHIMVPRFFANPAHWRNTRAGLAVLAELARTWPESLASRMETTFIAFGVNSLGETPSGSSMDEAIGGDSNPAAALFIVLEDVGQGATITISGRGSVHRLALRAAKDLWLPYRDRPTPQTREKPARRFRPSLFLLGEEPASWGSSLGKGRITGGFNPALLSATAQLVTEVALRWARQQNQAQGASAPKSSQNPG